MSEKIIHRGPDSDGIFVDDHVGLGFRRLSIIDLENGVQPMHSADGRYVIVFNGEIYNFKEIRKKLIREQKRDCNTLRYFIYVSSFDRKLFFYHDS